MTRYK